MFAESCCCSLESCRCCEPHTSVCCSFKPCWIPNHCVALKQAALFDNETANRDSSESEFHNHCPPLGKAVPSQWALPGRSSIFCPFGQKTRPNARLSCREGFAGPLKLLLAADDFKPRVKHGGCEGKEPLRTCVAPRQRKNGHLDWEVCLLCFGKQTFQVSFIQAEKWLDPRERGGAFLKVMGEAPMGCVWHSKLMGFPILPFGNSQLPSLGSSSISLHSPLSGCLTSPLHQDLPFWLLSQSCLSWSILSLSILSHLTVSSFPWLLLSLQFHSPAPSPSWFFSCRKWQIPCPTCSYPSLLVWVPSALLSGNSLFSESAEVLVKAWTGQH